MKRCVHNYSPKASLDLSRLGLNTFLNIEFVSHIFNKLKKTFNRVFLRQLQWLCKTTQLGCASHCYDSRTNTGNFLHHSWLSKGQVFLLNHWNRTQVWSREQLDFVRFFKMFQRLSAEKTNQSQVSRRPTPG